jgi:hypothetical protein
VHGVVAKGGSHESTEALFQPANDAHWRSRSAWQGRAPLSPPELNPITVEAPANESPVRQMAPGFFHLPRGLATERFVRTT